MSRPLGSHCWLTKEESSAEELGDVVDRIDPIDKCAFVPLVTRLGRAPSNTRPRRPCYSVLPPMNPLEQISPETATFERFLEFARPGGQFHPNFCSLIEQSLYNDPFSEEQLQVLAKKGQPGTLVAIVLAFAYGRFPGSGMGYRCARSEAARGHAK